MEGCDSTTELLPPSESRVGSEKCRVAAVSIARFISNPADAPHSHHSVFHKLHTSHSHSPLSTWPFPVSTQVVARGGFEPPKPLGRQIYSLLRLTAPQPRRCPDGPGAVRAEAASGRQPPPLPESGVSCKLLVSRCLWRYPRRLQRAASLELAEGFEPPTG